jgi:small GTP-binding protein
MIKMKICMLGAFAAGKTSLVERFVKSIFSDKYLTTVGVKIDKKTVQVKDRLIELLLWDLHGEDDFQKVRTSYLRGASGYFLVVDGTREATLETAYILQERAEDALGKIPFMLLLNKADLVDEWEIGQAAIEELRRNNWPILRTSAKTGEKVEEAFFNLTAKALEE